ncbi:MAG: hypothetical protein KC619_35835 [Myxococcales bacterium]|nr:hypothetical protein [Myxococcales bacterium]
MTSSKLASVPLDRLEKRLSAEPTDDLSIRRYLALFAERDDTPEQLIELSRRVINGHAKGVALVAGIRRAAARGLPIDPRVDALLGGGTYVQESWDLLHEWDGLEETLAAVEAIGPERGRKVVARLLGADPTFGLGCLGASLFPDDEVLREAVRARLVDWKFPSSEVAMGLSRLSPDRLPWWMERLGDLPVGSPGANLLKLGLQAALMRAARAERSWDPSLDAVLDVHGVWTDGDFMFSTYAAPVLREALAGMPADRVLGWLGSQLVEPPPATFTRLVLVVPRAHDDALRGLLTFLTAHAKLVRKPAFDWLTDLARELGARAGSFLDAVPKGKLRKAFESGLTEGGPSIEPAAPKPRATKATAKPPRKPAAITRLEKLASAVSDPEPIEVYALEAIRGASPSAVSRVGGPGYDLGPRQPSYEGLPMAHVFTLALADLPALQPRFEGAVAFALYVSEPTGNEAHEPYTDETAVLALSAADVERGEAAASPRDLPLRSVRVTAVQVPGRTFEHPTPHAKLREAIAALPARAGGAPRWLQTEQECDGFLLQLDDRFAPLNLGDAGVMYVFSDTAFWQSR